MHTILNGSDNVFEQKHHWIVLPTLESNDHKEDRRSETESRRYSSIMSGLGLGYPLSPWKAASDHPLGNSSVVEIGDVGILDDGAFSPIFNITRALNGQVNGERKPLEGVESPCSIPRGGIRVFDIHNQSEWLIQPTSAVANYASRYEGKSRIITMSLCERKGALLFLPQGGVESDLFDQMDFKNYAKLNWKEWFANADKRTGEPRTPTLYLVAGVERCSTWASAVWDLVSSRVEGGKAVLELSVDESTGSCQWTSIPTGCYARASTPGTDTQHAVFVRGYWVTRSDGNVGLCPRSLLSGVDRAGVSQAISEIPGPLYGVKVDMLDLSIAVNTFDALDHPCKVMNTFALALIGVSKPDLLDAGCAAISHDANWMDAVYHRLPVTSNIDIIRYVCSKSRFIVTGDIIYPDRTWDPDRALLERALILAHENQDDLIPTFVEFREPNSPPRFVFVRVWVARCGDIDVHSASRGGGSSNAVTVDTTAVLPRL